MKRIFTHSAPIKFTKDIGWLPHPWKAEIVGRMTLENTHTCSDASASIWAEAFGKTKADAKAAAIKLVEP